ncbi:nudix hydrolase 19, chloroplastic-like [Pyrus communis]|uniref:nudix hydrolase 19, chloroplastic-like n=1 Tax=Pyrus communis TaxID=23211 RepID=UPI0035BFAE00
MSVGLFDKTKTWFGTEMILKKAAIKKSWELFLCLARALLEWHSISQFCGHCGEKTVPKEAGRRKQCSSGLCRKRVYPRVDPPGESLEEAVRRETWEETGIEVGEVVYHSSQPWAVGPNSMPGQLMVGFFAYAKSLEINVDGEELDDIMVVYL